MAGKDARDRIAVVSTGFIQIRQRGGIGERLAGRIGLAVQVEGIGPYAGTVLGTAAKLQSHQVQVVFLLPDDGITKQRVAPTLVGNLGKFAHLVWPRCQLRTVGDHVVGGNCSKRREFRTITAVNVVGAGFALKLSGKLLLSPDLQEALIADVGSAQFQLRRIGEHKLARQIECAADAVGCDHFLTRGRLLGISEVADDQCVNLGAPNFAAHAAAHAVVGERFLHKIQVSIAWLGNPHE